MYLFHLIIRFESIQSLKIKLFIYLNVLSKFKTKKIMKSNHKEIKLISINETNKNNTMNISNN